MVLFDLNAMVAGDSIVGKSQRKMLVYPSLK